MKNQNIFIHILKTGGTTINSAMHGTYWQTTPDFNYRHITSESKKSNSGDIFDSENFDKYKAYIIFMMLRDPIDRMMSEYHFLKERAEFMDLLKIKPKNFEEYIRNPQTQNYMVGFLLGKRMYDINYTTRADFEKVKIAIDSLPIHVGIFEYFNDSLTYFTEVTGIKWAKKMEVKRITLDRPKKDSLSEETKNLIREKNALDVELYKHCLAKFKEKKLIKNSNSVTFISDKYNHVLAFSARATLYEFCVNNKNYLKQNLLYFRDLTFYLHKDLQLKDGKKYMQIWNKTYVDSVNESFPETPFSKAINEAYSETDEPLDVGIRIGKTIDDFFENTKKKFANRYYVTMKFDAAKVLIPKEKSKNFFSKLFGK